MRSSLQHCKLKRDGHDNLRLTYDTAYSKTKLTTHVAEVLAFSWNFQKVVSNDRAKFSGIL